MKSGAYQEAFFEPTTNEYKCKPTEKCVKIFAAAEGYEAAVTRYSGTAGAVTIPMKSSPAKNSAIIRGRGRLPGIEGDVNPIYDNLKRLYLYADKIGLEKNGRPAQQPLAFKLNERIDAESPTGRPFKIWVIDITQAVSVLEYTLPE